MPDITLCVGSDKIFLRLFQMLRGFSVECSKRWEDWNLRKDMLFVKLKKGFFITKNEFGNTALVDTNLKARGDGGAENLQLF